MRILMALLISAFALGFAAPSALAADHELYSKDDVFPGESPGAHMWFNEHGDTVTLCDNDADGQKAYVGVHANGPGTSPTYELRVGGDGRCVTRNAASGKRFNLPENTRITFSVCVDGGNGPNLCGEATWKNDH